jgi:GNAT superfamily N-acetyltransferase
VIRLRTCTHADTPLLVRSLNECLYQGYRFKVVMTPERFLEDSRIHDVDLTSTFLALDDGVPVGITLVARRGDAAWIAGMGVHPDLRGHGIGTELLRRVQDRLRGLGVRTIELEVLIENEVARRCYTTAGFVAQRRYSCFRGTATRVPWGGQASRVVKSSADKILDQWPQLHRAQPCWQRCLATLRHRAADLKGLVAARGGHTVATLLYSESAVSDVGWRAEGGSPLDRPLHELLIAAFGPSRPFAIVNVPSDDPLAQVMSESGFEIYADQLDMRCTL